MGLRLLFQGDTHKVRDAFWGLGDIFRVAGLYLLVLLPVSMLFARIPNVSPVFAKTIALLSVMAVHQKMRFWPGLEYFGLQLKDFKQNLKVGVLWGLVAKVAPVLLILLLLIPVVLIMGDSLPDLDLQPNHEAGNLAPFSAAWILTAFGLVVLAPVVEELFIRGILYGFLRTKWGVRIGVLVSSLVFALLHGIGFILIPTFVAGVVFAILYERTGSLATCIIAHSTFNLVAVVISSL